MVYSALAVGLMAEGTFFVPICAQEKVVQTMTLTTLYDIADRQSQKVRVSEIALRAADEGVAAAKSALLPSVDLSLQGSYTGNAFMLSRGFSTNGTTDYIVPGVGTVPVANGKQDTPHWGNSFTAQVYQVVYAGGAIRSGIRMAELGKEMAKLDVEKNRQEVRFLLTGYYLDLCKIDNQMEVVRQNITLTQKEIEQMKARRVEGTVLQNDITRYEFQLQSLELTLTKLTDAFTVINHQLVTTLHLPEQTVIAPDKNELDTEINALSAIAAQETWQQTATDNNLGIRQATVATDLAEQKVKQVKAESLPSVAVVAENQLYGPYTQDLIPKDCNVNVWFVGIGVKYSLGSLWKNKHNIRKARIVLCLLGGAVYVVSQFMRFGSGEFTDNARVRQNVVPQSSRVQGFIREVRFTDFQQVKKGDTLVIIEDTEFRLRLAQAETDLLRAEQGSKGTASSIVTTKTSMTVTEAGIESARAQMENAMREDNRFKNLLSQDAVTPQQYDKVHTAYLSAKATYEQAVRSRQMQSAVVAEQGHHLSASEQGIELARRAVDLARLNLSYCYIIATCDGTVGTKDIHAGQLVNPGQTLVSIVDKDERWIEANYKESQLPHIKVGNKVEITADAVPGVEYTGTVERISDATGSAFSLIPIDNATGNFVKVEQRVTLRIKLDPSSDVAKLKGGYNVECIVKE